MEEYDDGTNPFAEMFMGERKEPNFVTAEEIHPNHENYHQMYDESNFKPDPELCIKPEMFENSSYDLRNGGNDDSSFMDEYDSKSFPEHPESNASQDQSSQNDSQRRRKGRPRGSKTGTGRRPLKVKTIDTSLDKLPKMKHNIHTLRLAPEQIVELKKLPSFFQPGVCYQITPNLDKCKECFKKKFNKSRPYRGDVECRFYQFRKLRYVGDDLQVAGFSDPTKDPKDVDRSIWLSTNEKLRHKMSLQHARLILTHVGGDLCRIIEKEKVIFQKYSSLDKPIIWKRLIDSVIEICDLCSTTLFNYHFICNICGISLCADCVMESESGEFEISCSRKEQQNHRFEDMMFTQIIVNGAMEELQQKLHETYYLWDIDHECNAVKEPPKVERATFNLARNLLNEMITGKSVMGRELQDKNNIIEVDLGKLRQDPQPEPVQLNLNFDDYLKVQPPFQKEHCKPVQHLTDSGKENVISISRRMSQATSNMFYPNVPHRWLCENKLLRLLDPLCPGNDAIFHEQWQRGQPVLVSSVLEHFKQELWIPEAFSNEFGHDRSDLINCMTGNVVRNREISDFWDGFENVEKRIIDTEGRHMLLKLKDWPPDSDFKNIMPSRFDDVMKNLPLNSYTNRNGDLNIVKYLPNCFLHPDLGPKGYFAYGSPFFLKEGTTNLHLDVSDACNVMCYIGFPRDKNITIDEYIEQGFQAILESDADISNTNRVTEDGEIPGAIWHIFESADADRIRDFLLKIAQERGFQVAPDHDVIHDQNWYLDGELRSRLFKEYGVKGYAIVQCLGDCIILPAGTPHQVRNIYSCIKIAEDFISPQQVAHCLRLSAQFRKLTKTHTNNEEKLNIKNVAYHSCKEAMATLVYLMNKKVQFYDGTLKTKVKKAEAEKKIEQEQIGIKIEQEQVGIKIEPEQVGMKIEPMVLEAIKLEPIKLEPE